VILESRQLCELAARASNLYERASAIPHADQSDILRACFDDRVRAALRAWQQAFAPGDPDAFARRLAWDGFDVGRALLSVAPIGSGRVPAVPAPWTEWVPRIASAVADTPPAVRSACAADLRSCGLPFDEILAPLVVAARLERIRRCGDAPPDLITASAVADLERRLAWELSFFGERALFELFASERPQQVQSHDSAHYGRFVQRLLAERLLPLFDTFPVLARQWAIVVEGWVSATGEMIERLSHDRNDIVSMIGLACDRNRERPSAGSEIADPGPVTAIKAGLSDPHHGRRRVAILVFENGEQVVYKPRSLAFDAAFQHLLRFFASRGLDPAPRALAVVDRTSYGWIEYVSSGAFTTSVEVDRYYRQAGSLLAIAWLLGGRDLHMENVIATCDGPVLVDLEMFLGPVRTGPRANVSESSGQQDHGRLDQSVLASGLLSLYETTETGEIFDIGGLRGGRTHATVRARRWKGLGTDALAYTDDLAVDRAPSNVVAVAGVPQSPSDHVDAVVAGFDAVCSIAAEHEDGLSGGDGVLEAFASCSTRFLLRPTEQYARLLALLATPKYQRDGAAASAAWDAILRSYARSRVRPIVWPLVEAERAALAGLDVPHFDVPCSGTSVGVAGTALMPQPAAQSGLDAARLRITRLSSARHRERARLRMALRQTPETRFRTVLEKSFQETHFTPGGTEVPPSENTSGAHAREVPPSGNLRDGFIAAAEWIGREMIARSEEDRPAVAHPDLYAGSAGPMLAYSALAAVTGRPEWNAAACAAIHEVIDSSSADRELALGICSGPLSTAYALLVAGALADLPDARDVAVRLARGLTFEHVMADPFLDVAAGSAGALLALAALFDATRDERWLTAARWCGERLDRAAIRDGRQAAWPAVDGRRYIGFAHGAAGIAHALLRLHGLTGEARWSELWDAAVAFERTAFAGGNWGVTDATGDSGPSSAPMIAWCHGAAGVVLARAHALQLGRTSVMPELAEGLHATTRLPAQRADHLCCGNFGRVEALFSAGRILDAPPVVDAAFELACDRLRVARDRGHFRLSASPHEYRVFDPGFFHGLSGIAWQLLRLAAPETLPSIMTFDPPVSSPV
jgi:type 2 lantibiotic biosynthesis protein LanM